MQSPLEIIVQAAKTRVILAIVKPKLYIARPVISLTAKKRFISFPFASKISQFGGIKRPDYFVIDGILK